MREVRLWDAGPESARDTYGRDQVMLAAVAADPAVGWWRVWHRPQPALVAGRFHRLAMGTPVARRLSGGRIIPVGPGVLCSTLMVSDAAVLDRSRNGLRPDQVLNRALRPMLAILRELGLDAFYPGRDLVTVAGRPILYASFTTASDGVVVVEQFAAVRTPFSNLASLIDADDPDNVAGLDRNGFSSSVAVDELAEPPDREDWIRRLAAHASEAWWASVEPSSAFDHVLASATLPSDESYECFQRERGPAPAGHKLAGAISMLGIVEVSASLVEGTIADMVVCGDIIAPFRTLEAIADACARRRPADADLPQRVSRALRSDGGFALGAGDLTELVRRLA